jgi:hypothetical protein
MGEEAVARIFPKRVAKPGLNFSYPEIEGPQEKRVLKQINEAITRKVRHLIRDQGYAPELTREVAGGYQVKLNAKGILSLRLEGTGNVPGDALRTIAVKGLTFDLHSGDLFKFEDLFNDDCDYVSRLNGLIRQTLNAGDDETVAEFGGVLKRQEFYMTETALILVFPLPEDTPAQGSVPELAIGYPEVRDLIYKNGPIGRFLR